MSLAGGDRRFKRQLYSKKTLIFGLNPVDFALFMMASIILGTSSFVTLSYIVSSVISLNYSSDANPTSIPWINNKSDCEHTSRTWHDDKCWDYEHNPMF